MDNNNMMNNGPDDQFDSYQHNTDMQGSPAPQYYGNDRYNPNDPYTMNGSYDPNAQYGMPNYNQQPYQPYQPYQEGIYAQPGESGSANGKAIASLVCGIFSLLLCCCYGIPAIILGVIAIVMAVLSKKDNMGQFPGIAIAGLVCGIIGIVFGIGYIVVWLIGYTRP